MVLMIHEVMVVFSLWVKTVFTLKFLCISLAKVNETYFRGRTLNVLKKAFRLGKRTVGHTSVIVTAIRKQNLIQEFCHEQKFKCYHPRCKVSKKNIFWNFFLRDKRIARIRLRPQCFASRYDSWKTTVHRVSSQL